jgi:dTDP-4-amino-4,6-dideoxygalactose transaminase
MRASREVAAKDIGRAESMNKGSPASYRHRLVLPDLPAPAEYLSLLEEMRANGWYSNFGPLVRRFEVGLLAHFGASDETCVTCCNATAGLSAALLATGRSGQVLLPAFTFPASLGAVRAAGMTPIVVDIDAQTWALSAPVLDRALAETGAGLVMLVTPFGIQRSWDAQLKICRKHGAAVVIDNAAGLGGPRTAESEDLFEVFSLHATKPFAVGEGGAIFAHRDYDAVLRSVVNFALGSYDKPEGPAWGFNGKMSEFHAAVGLAQLDRFSDSVVRRRAFVAVYRERLAHYPELVCPRDVHCAPWQSFPVLLPSRVAAERFIEAAAAAGVEIRRYYRPSVSRWPATACFEACPIAEDLADRMCVLPVRALAAGSERDEIIELVLGALDRTLTGIDNDTRSARQ